MTRERILALLRERLRRRGAARRAPVDRRFGAQAAVVAGVDGARRARRRACSVPTAVRGRTTSDAAYWRDRSCSPASAARSAAAPTRSTATTSPNASSASHPNPASTATSPGVTGTPPSDVGVRAPSDQPACDVGVAASVAAGEPLVEVGGLVADGGGVAVAGVDDGLGGQREQPVADRRDDRRRSRSTSGRSRPGRP